jgi:hypothetical protein
MKIASASLSSCTDRNWINRVTDNERRVELGRIVCSILGSTTEEAASLEADLRAGLVKFPLPISERLVAQDTTQNESTDGPADAVESAAFKASSEFRKTPPTGSPVFSAGVIFTPRYTPGVSA